MCGRDLVTLGRGIKNSRDMRAGISGNGHLGSDLDGSKTGPYHRDLIII